MPPIPTYSSLLLTVKLLDGYGMVPVIVIFPACSQGMSLVILY